MSVTGITITGTNASAFSQKNTCNSSVPAATPCAINVTFTPGATGSYSAAVSIADGSTDSPQQVALAGSGVTRLVVNASAVHDALANSAAVTVPSPTGHNTVGTRVMSFLDLTRNDPYVVDSTKREIAARFWYPASLRGPCKPAGYTPPAVWQYFAQLTGVRPFEVVTNSCLNAPVTDGLHPVVLFTPGYTATFTDYTFLFEDLASRGYIVASIAHTYESTAVELPDRGLVKGIFGTHFDDTWRGDEQTFSLTTYVRLQDLEFIFSELVRLDAQQNDAFSGHLDMSRVAVAGHSLGGLTALLAIDPDSRFKAGIALDSYVPADLARNTKISAPVFLLTAGRNEPDTGECRLWSNLKGPRLSVNLPGAEHVAFSDLVWLAKDGIQTGPAGPESTIAAVRAYVAAFLDAHLRGEPADPLLTGPSPEYRDAAVTTEHESFCRQP